ncbi:uncharacterized protein LOC130898875 [Diorhabda carinulata]|uniref:uncharacterized protein LOC130898875 n=1 Tax=Diorhabda carinulata TaxID=1163345 RepID=UPI0025A07FA2|nr:uncharacterized protein LOC130898875 [Diorhabda carinulata]
MHRLRICFIFFLVLHMRYGYASFKCFSCVGGPNTKCARELSQDETENCETQCFETYIEYQSGVFPLVERRCWDKPANTNKRNYCEWLPSQSRILNTNATIKSCSTCESSKCNNNQKLAPVMPTCKA